MKEEKPNPRPNDKTDWLAATPVIKTEKPKPFGDSLNICLPKGSK